MNISIEKTINFVFEDPRWKEKATTGTLVMLISTILLFALGAGIVGFLIVVGWCVRLLQNVRDDRQYPLPEWDQWGDDLVRGFKLAVVSVVWTLPAILLFIPLALSIVVAGDGSNDAATAIGVTIIMFGACFLIIYSLAVTVAMPGFTIAFARDEQIMSGLAFREIWNWTVANIGQVVLVTIIYIAAASILPLLGAIAGAILICVGLIVTIPLSNLAIYVVQYHLMGQLARLYPIGGSVGPIDSSPPPPADSAATF